MKGLLTAVLILAGALFALAEPDLTGVFSYDDGEDQESVAIQVTIRPATEGKLSLELMAGHPDGHGAAPDGGGEGEVDRAGVFRFTYEDSFSNKGTGTFRRTRKGYLLSIKIDDVQDSRCLVFYGDKTLQRRSAKE